MDNSDDKPSAHRSAPSGEPVIYVVPEAVQASAAVLWIRSTVADAIEDYRLFDQSDVPTMHHHSRWADHDRRILDGRVIRAIGKAGERGRVETYKSVLPAVVLRNVAGSLHGGNRNGGGTVLPALDIHPARLKSL